MVRRNRFFEIFVLLLLTLGIATIGILYIRERVKKRHLSVATGYKINIKNKQELKEKSPDFDKYNDILSRLRRKYLHGLDSARYNKKSNQNIHRGNAYSRYLPDSEYEKRKRDDLSGFKPPEGMEMDEYLFRKAVLHYRHLRFRATIRTVDELILNYPSSKYKIRARCYQGMAFMKIGKENWKREYLTLAKNILITALQDYLNRQQFEPGEFTEFVIAVGEANRSIGGSNQEIEYLLKKALALAPASHRNDLFVQLGYIALFRKNYHVAMNYFLKSNSELARIGMARAYVNMGKYEKAFRIYDEFVTYNKDSEYYPDVKKAYIKQAFHWGKREFANGNFALSYKFLTRLTAHFPDIPQYAESQFIIAQAFFNKKAYKYARKYYKRIAVTRNEKFGDIALYKIGQSYYIEKQFRKAMEYFDKLIKTYPSSGYRKEAENYNKMIITELATKTQGPGGMLEKDDIENEDERKKIPTSENNMLREP